MMKKKVNSSTNKFMGNPCPWGHTGERYVYSSRCVECHKNKRQKNVKKECVATDDPVKKESLAEPPRTMGFDDYRRVFRVIDDHYIDRKSGYGDGFDDAAVAKKINVPRAWVTKMRGDWFGPEVKPFDFGPMKESVEKMKAEAISILERKAELKTALDDIMARTDAIENDGQALFVKITEVSNRLSGMGAK